MTPEKQLDVKEDALEFLCPKCNRPLKLKEGQDITFFGCTGFPKCKGYFPVDDEGGPCFDKSSTKPRRYTRRDNSQIER